MIQLDRHIEILLLDNDCVIVPGLGGFMAHHVSATYSTDSLMFIPPMRQLGFNPQLQINDSLLAQSYIEAYDISYPEALRRIDDEVTELKQNIQNEGFCELNDIGVLRLNAEGRIEFEPCEAGILTPMLYGLNSVEIKPLSTGSSQEETRKKPAPLTIVSEEPKPIPQLTKQTVDEDENDESETELQESHITIRVSTLKHIGSVAAVIIALFVCAIPFGNTSQPEISKSYIDTGVLYNILPEGVRAPIDDTAKNITFKKAEPIKSDSLQNQSLDIAQRNNKKEEAKPANTEAEKTNKENVKVAADEAKTTDSHFFSIVLASRVSKTNAEEFVKKLKKSGFDRAEVIARNNGSKVIYGRYKTEAEANNSLHKLRSSEDETFSEGWVMKF